VDVGEGVFVFCELANQFEDCWDVWFVRAGLAGFFSGFGREGGG
jgi:hypothetical protein